jgi:uncharacterized repeat protein (TIGR03803 family)
MNMGRFTVTRCSGWLHVCAAFLFCAVAAVASSAQTFNVLTNFELANGIGPNGPLAQGFDGNFYGTTNSGWPRAVGTVFKVTPAGTLTTLYTFCPNTLCTDGERPLAGLTLGPDGNFYGTTDLGGANNLGTVFKVTPGGVLTTLYDFGSPEVGSGSAISGLVRAGDGNFYGTTNGGGANHYGEVFKISAAGQFTTIYSFCSKSSCADGMYPFGLTLGADGALYGTTLEGGVGNCGQGFTCGTIFRITTAGKLTRLYAFPSGGAQGWMPVRSLVQGADGSFYGSTYDGGANDAGTIFKLTAPGKLTTLYNLCSAARCTDGLSGASLVQGTDGNFYGTTFGGGDRGCDGYNIGCGTIFSMTPAGALTTLHIFEAHDGVYPEELVQATDGNFYGVAPNGGDLNCLTGLLGCGTVFSLSAGLGPFVKPVPDFGKVGQTGGILGQGLTGTTGVFLNGTPASFTVVSDTFIKATVPAGATSGFVTVNTPSGTLTSNVPFQVSP